jgi:FtsP/CotA-like multicopper oxidase with cupredoxin domain
VYPASASSQWDITERLPPGQTFSLTWTATRPGNWLFHCHDTVHIVRQPNPLNARSASLPSADHAVNHALEMMSGPVMGITVHPTGAPAVVSDATTRRQLRLVARVDYDGTPAEPAYGFSLEERGQAIPPAPPCVTGPVILLKRGEPVSIVVENRLPEATAIHWHGIELDSYYDGVAGFAGDAGRIAPAIPPGGVVRGAIHSAAIRYIHLSHIHR